MRRFLSAVLFVWVVFCLYHAVYAADAKWYGTPDSPHHAAVVPIRQGSAGGTAFIVSSQHAVTAAHCVDSGNRCSLQVAGQTVLASVVSRDDRNDAALLRLDYPTTVQPLRLGSKPSQPGELLEICGYGGPSGRLRHFWSTAIDERHSKSALLNGDSGGPVIRYKTCEVVGVVSGGQNVKPFYAAEDRSKWQYVYPAAYATPTPLRNFGRWIIGAPKVQGYLQPIGRSGYS